jgi:hypothetical protein
MSPTTTASGLSSTMSNLVKSVIALGERRSWARSTPSSRRRAAAAKAALRIS